MAGCAVLSIGRSKRRDGAARPGPRVLPWHAGALAAFAEHFTGRSAGNREVAVGWRARGLRSYRAGALDVIAVLAPEGVELVAAGGQTESQGEHHGSCQ